jgi:glycosyltransferase involved in cell wall biosynthesis
VAIYAPFASAYYERNGAQSGGAELQTTLLARELAGNGLSVAHVVYAVSDPVALEPPAPDLVERPPWTGDRRLGEGREMAAIWRGLMRARARAYIVRGSGGHVVAAASFCRAFRRRLIFSASNDLDFVPGRHDRNPHLWRAYRSSVRHSNRIVTQTANQLELARAAVPEADPILIRSFAQQAPPANGDPRYFLWINRLADYKHPERFLDLAEALPDIPFRMVGSVLRGETSVEEEDRIRRRADGLPNLELVPPRHREELLEELTHAAAVVSTSEAEGMPNTFLEAWSRGVPVVSLTVDPDQRIRQDGVGIMAEGSMDRLVEATATVWRDRDLRGRLGESAREFVQRVHSPQAVGRQWAELVRQVLGGQA